MKLEIGMYVRLDRSQGIRRVVEYDAYSKHFILDKEIMDEYADETTVLYEDDIIKTSYNIKDLLEVGDVIKFDIVTSLETNNHLVGYIDITDEEMLKEIKNNKDYNVLAILTKEQVASEEYAVTK